MMESQQDAVAQGTIKNIILLLIMKLLMICNFWIQWQGAFKE